jgi:hypothetical protein
LGRNRVLEKGSARCASGWCNPGADRWKTKRQEEAYLLAKTDYIAAGGNNKKPQR